MPDEIGRAAMETTELLANGVKDAARSQYWQAVERFGYSKFNYWLLRAIADRAGRARRDGHHDIVCRLREAASNQLLTGADKALVKTLFIEAGAAGRQSSTNRHRPTNHTSMVALTKG